MRKKLLLTLSVLTLTSAMTTSVFARNNFYNYEGMMYQNSNFSKSNFTSFEELEKRLQEDVANNNLTEEEKDFYLNMYEYCSNNYNGGNFGNRRNKQFSCH